MKFARKTSLCSLIGVVALALVALTPQVGGGALVAAGPQLGGVATAGADAVAGARQDGPVTVTSVLTSPTTGSSMTMARGVAQGATVSTAAETIKARRQRWRLRRQPDVLGGQQLVVTIVGTRRRSSS